MAETDILGGSLPSFFWGNDPNVNQQLRQRLALQMMSQRKAPPKNIGEGLSAIGDSIGDIGMAKRLEAADLAQQAAAKGMTPPPAEAAAAAPLPASVTNANASMPPADMPLPQSPTGPAPPPMQTSSAPVPFTGRDAIAAQLMATGTAPGVPPANPTSAGAEAPPSLAVPPGGQPSDQRLALGPQPDSNVASDITPVPPVPPSIRQAPMRVAQAAPDPAYVTPQQAAPTRPKPAPMSRTEIWAQQQIIDNPNNPYVAQRFAPLLKREQDDRAAVDKANFEKYQSDLIQGRSMADRREQMLSDQAKRVVDVQKTQGEVTAQSATNQLRQQFANLPPEDVLKLVSASQTQAQSAANALVATQNARAALDRGIIAGSGANQKLDTAKLFTALGLVDKGNLIANTEMFRAAMQPVVASILHATSGTSQLSDNELAFAKAAAAGDIRLDPQSIRMLMTIIDKQSNDIIHRHQTKMDAFFPNSPQAKALYGVEVPSAPKSQDDEARQWLQQNPNDPRAAAIAKRLGIR